MHHALIEGHPHLFGIGEGQRLLAVGGHPFPQGERALPGEVVEPQDDVLGGNDNGVAVGRGEDVVGGHHQGPGLDLGLNGQRHVHRHLVTVEVGVEGRTHQGVQLDGLAFDERGLKGLDAQAVQGGRPVEHHRMLPHHFVQDVPDLRGLPVHQALGHLDGGGVAPGHQLMEDEGLEELQGHLLGQAALVQLQFRADDDDRAAGVVHPFAQQVLPEPPLLAFEHVGKRLQGPLVGAGDGAAPAAVLEEHVHRFLQHALFVADDDVRGVELQQTFQTVVAVDHPAVQVVEIGGGKPAAVQVHQGTQVRRQHRDHFHDHPFGPLARFPEGVDDL